MLANEHHLDALVQCWRLSIAQGKPLSAAELCRDCPELIDQLSRGLRARALRKPSDELAGDRFRAPAVVQHFGK